MDLALPSNGFSASTWTAVVALGIVPCVVLARLVLKRALEPPTSGSKSADSSSAPPKAPIGRGRASAKASDVVQREDYPDLDIPEQPHVELALDPPCGLHFSNPDAPHSFENEFCTGKFIYFHPPTSSEPAGAGSLDYHKYFKGKKRVWELRVEFSFKRPPSHEEDLFFGVELEDYVPTNAAMKRVGGLAVAAIRQAVGEVYQSYGDDPAETEGECEKPTCVLPLWAFDQFIETPEGQEAPSLTAVNFSQLGKRRYNRVKEYAEEIATLGRNFKVGATYSFAFWGNSRFLDVVNWRLLGLPFVTPLDFDKLAGRPPVHAVLYSLPAVQSTTEEGQKGAARRHLVSRKQYYFKAAIWSSLRRPARSRFEALTGATLSEEASVATVEQSQKKKTLGRRLRRFGSKIRDAASDSMYCCVANERKMQATKAF